MPGRRWCGAVLLPFALAACGPAPAPAPAPEKKATANEAAPPAAAAPVANSAVETSSEQRPPPEPQVEVPEDAPGLAEMSPFRRRAYEAGYRDCRAGRYDPDPWPEAYRIGCGAAQEAQ
jgi:hypothetical protein